MDLIIDNIEEAIVNTKKQLKSALPDLKEIFKDVEHYISEEVSIIEASIDEGKSVIPEILYKDIDNGNIDLDTIDLVKKRGCVVIRNVFSKSLIDEWNEELGKYIYDNLRSGQKNPAVIGIVVSWATSLVKVITMSGCVSFICSLNALESRANI